MAGILDLIGALTGASNTSGGIKTMPGTNELSYAPMTVARPGLDAFLTGGQGKRRAQGYNDNVLAQLLSQQEANRGSIATTKERGAQDRLTQAEITRLQKEIQTLQADLERKQTLLKQSSDVGAKYGIPLTSEADVKTMGGALTDPTIQAALQRILMSTKVMGSPAGQQAFEQGTLATMQAPAIENLSKSRFQTPPATITTMPQSDATGMINLANTGRPVMGMQPFSEEVQQMTTLPSGMQLPGAVTRSTGYRPPPVPRPEAFKRDIRALQTMPQQQADQTPLPPQAMQDLFRQLFMMGTNQP